MTFKTTQLRDAITFALAVGSTALAGAAVAQEANAPATKEATTLDRIEVTGSRIRQVDLETAQPVLSITRADIEKQGFQSVADILQNISATGAPTISRAQPLLAGENVGGQFISMRNLGATRTLILVNGKRLGISTSGLQDISLIPTSAVERIEVLKDGASSIYGSDAIAGVVNIITRTNFEGASANAYFGQYSQGDGATTRADFVLGFTGDRGSLTAAVEYRKEDEVFARDREFGAYPQGPMHPDRGWTTVSQWGVLNLPTAAGGNRVLNQDGDWRRLSNFHALNTDNGSREGSTVDKSNTNLQTHLRTPLESRSLFVNGVFDITDKVRFRSDMLYSSRDAERQVAGYPFQSGSAGPVPGGFKMSKDSYYNPVGTLWAPGNSTPGNTIAAQDVNFWRRTWEVPRVDKSTSTTWRFSAGLDGSFDIGERSFDWDVGYLFNNNKVTQENYGNLNIERTKQAVGPSFLNANGVVQCGSAAAPIPLSQCVPWNPYIPYGRVGDGGLTGNKALQDFLFQRLNSSGETKTNVYSANLSGSLFALPGGDFGFAVGYEHRKEEGRFIPDAQAVTGNSTTLAGGPTNGSYSVDEFFVELAIPVLADLPGAKELSFSVASRYSDYSTFGDTVNNKFGFKWKPIDSLLFRGTYADGFRAPTINDLYGGGSQTFIGFTDPCDTVFGAAKGNPTVQAACGARGVPNPATFRQLQQGLVPSTTEAPQTPVPFFSGANPNLIPETSKSRTLGVVWSPEFVEGLNVSLDWWKVKIEDTIVGDTPTQMLNDCYLRGDASRCTAFTRDPVLGYVTTLNFNSINAGYREAEGYDLELNYRLPTSIGNFNLNWQTTYTASDEIKTDTNPRSAPIQLVGHAVNQSNLGTFRIRSNASLSWEKGPLSATWGARYYSSQKESCLSAALFPSECDNPTYRAPDTGGSIRAINKLGSNTFHDVEFRVATPWNATVAIGANNVFDHLGPTLYSAPSANTAYSGQFDIGRFVYMKYQQRF